MEEENSITMQDKVLMVIINHHPEAIPVIKLGENVGRNLHYGWGQAQCLERRNLIKIDRNKKPAMASLNNDERVKHRIKKIMDKFRQ